MPSSTCAHGFAPGACLICQTLGMSPGVPAKTKRSAATIPAARPGDAGAVASPAHPLTAGVHVLPAPRRRLTFGTKLLGLAVIVVVALVVLWWVALIAATVWRYVVSGAVTVGAGYIGWRLGVRHGRRHPRPT